jgi:hypothetical protein
MIGGITMNAAQNIRRGLTAFASMLIMTAPLSAAAQEEAPPPPEYGTGLQFTNLANMPIAGLLDRGNYEIDMRMYPEGGLYSFVTIGFLRGINIGFSYGAENVIGRGKVDWNPNVEFAFRARLIPESTLLPALAVGYAGQGFGPHLSDPDPMVNLDRYAVKSPGFYLVLSKNYRILTEMGFHFGLNRSRETDDDDDLNAFLGVDFSLSPYLYLITEYDAALNDNGDTSVGYGNGYLNFGVKWAASPHLRLEFFFTNLLDNVRGEAKSATIENIAGTLGGAGREFRVVYVDWF